MKFEGDHVPAWHLRSFSVRMLWEKDGISKSVQYFFTLEKNAGYKGHTPPRLMKI